MIIHTPKERKRKKNHTLKEASQIILLADVFVMLSHLKCSQIINTNQSRSRVFFQH